MIHAGHIGRRLAREASIFAVSLAACALWGAPAMAQRVAIDAGSHEPFYPLFRGEVLEVPAFEIDVLPVTNGQYLEFVQAETQWRRDLIPSVFADEGYLSSWAGPAELGDAAAANAPVAFVSWFAAGAYCEWAGGALPNESQWELVARADHESADGSGNPEFVQRILTWYSRPRTDIPVEVGQSATNFFGVADMHALHWEWVLDYNASLVSGDNRQDGDRQNQRFCGGAAVSAADTADYAAFMRYAFRGSLSATYTVHNLGFRCVAD